MLIDRAKSEFSLVTSKSSSEIFSYINQRLDYISKDSELATKSIEQFLRFSNFESAQSLLHNSFELLSDFNKNFFAARIAYGENNFSEAHRFIELINASDPNVKTGSYFRLTASVYSELNMLPALLSAIGKWSALWPTRAEPFLLLAEYYATKGCTVEARAAYVNSLKLEWDSPAVNLSYCNFLLSNGDIDGATELVQKIIPITSNQKKEVSRLFAILGLDNTKFNVV